MDIFKITLFSFLKPDDCKKAVLTWNWKIFAVFALLSAISALGIMLGTYKPLENIYDNTIQQAIEGLKNVKIKDGKIITPNAQDISLKDADGNVFAIASQNYIDANKTKALLFALEKDRITLYMPDGSETFFSAKEYKPIIGKNEITADTLIPEKKLLLFVFLPILSITFSLVINTMYTLMMTAATFVLSRTIYPILTFTQCIKLAIIALAPSTIIDFVFATFLGQPILGFVYALISGGIVFYLLKKFQQDTP